MVNGKWQIVNGWIADCQLPIVNLINFNPKLNVRTDFGQDTDWQLAIGN
jgi:hypothetical protein